MAQVIISEFLISKPVHIIEDIKELYENGKWNKALCKNKNSFPYLKQNLKKWLPVHIKWISSHCNDIHFLMKHKKSIDYKNLSSNQNIFFDKDVQDILSQNLNKVDWWELSMNKNAVSFLKKYPKKIIWQAACLNKSSEMLNWIEELYLSNNLDMTENWAFLSCNKEAIHFLKKYKDFIDKRNINLNSNAVPFLRENPDLIDYKVLCYNNSKEAIELLKERIEKGFIEDLCFEYLSTNPYATDILLKYPEKIVWDMTILNENVGELYKYFPDKVIKYIKYTANYPSVIPYIKENLYNISPVILATNPNIFHIDKEEYKTKLKDIQKFLYRIKNIK